MMHVQGKMKYIFEYHPHRNDSGCQLGVFEDDRMEWVVYRE